jgi:hypothetical protein
LQFAFVVHGMHPGRVVCVQPVAVQASVVHALLSSQLSGVPGVHTPAWQVSRPLQAFPSEHDAPLGTGV